MPAMDWRRMKTIEIDLDGSIEELFCPACGMEALEAGIRGWNPCEHLVFLTDDASGEVSYNAPGFQEKAEKFMKILSEEGELERAAKGIQMPATAFLMAVTTHGMACGPVSSTSYICFDMAGVPEEGD